MHRLLLDVSSLTYRAFFAMPDSVKAPDGRPVNAVHGYLDMVTRLVANRRPDEVVHVYDHDWRPVERTDIYPGYKSNRPPEPEAITQQFALLRSVIDLTGLLQAETEGWEAEDAIGAFCVEADEADRIEIVSGDRDLIQLVRDPVVKLLFTLRGVSELGEYDEAGVLAKYGVPASRYAEFAILRGDPSDDLPGRARRRREDRAGVGDHLRLPRRPARRRRAGPSPSRTAQRQACAPREDPDSAEYLDAMRRLVPVNAVAPLTVWSGARDDAALKAFADEHGLKGPIQRLQAALDSANAA